MPRPKTRPGPLSELARHVVLPSGIVSTGWPAVREQCESFGDSFDEWQDGAGRAILAKRSDGYYAATVGGVTLSIPRQVAKTFLVSRIVFALCVLYPGLTVIWTAHRTRTATNSFRSMMGYARRKKVAPHVRSIRTANGEQEIAFTNGSVILFGAREQGFGRGFDEVDAIVFDEAQILTEKALDDMVPAANQSRHPHGALVFFMGTPPRPSDPGESFTIRRTKALEGQADNLVYIEFSADPDASPDDRGQWALANPSYPLHTPAQSIERLRELLADDESFMREALGVWDPAKTPQVIDPQTWALQADPASMALERLTLAVDVEPSSRSVTSVALAGQRIDGKWHVELDEHREGADWVPAWIEKRVEQNKIHAVVLDEMSGLVEHRNGRHYVKGTDVAVTLAASNGRDMAIACAKFYDGMMDGTVVHTDQPQVNVALSVARKRSIGAGWGWNRKGATSDITPIVACTLALWGAQSSSVKKPAHARASERRAVVL